MYARLFIGLLVMALVAVGCSSGSKAEKEVDKTTTQPAETEEAEGAETEEEEKAIGIAPCTAGADVPAGAQNCLLDLGTGVDTYWADTDGVDPGTAGCHYEFTDNACRTFKEGRTFGELCLDSDRLVESNPGADECHTHGQDMGKPDVVSCSQWCQEQSGVGGSCESGVAAEGAHGSCQSARCVCDTTG